MTSGDEDAVMAVLTAHQHNGGGLERRMEVAKAKLESFKESSTLRKIEEFLKAPRLGRSVLVEKWAGQVSSTPSWTEVALGRTSKEEDSPEKNRNGSAFEVRWLLCGTGRLAASGYVALSSGACSSCRAHPPVPQPSNRK